MIQLRPLVVASESAARGALLRNAGIEFQAMRSGVDEAAIKAEAQTEGRDVEDVALMLALAKAGAVTAPGQVVIGADQMLVCGERWFDKPPDMAAARAQLQALRGRRHALVTAVVAVRDGAELWRHVALPMLTMRPFSDAFLEAYLALEGERVLGSVGAYRLEGPGVHLFDRVEGEHSAILGLPMPPLLRFLREAGVLAV